MEKQEFSIMIDAPREKVWETLWGKDSYPKWTAAFSENSSVKTDWEKGGKAIFHDGTGNGMLAVIEENIPNEFMSIKHIGMIKDGVEDTESDEVKQWAGAHENYTLKNNNGKTDLLIEMDINNAWKEYFMNTWPKALDKVKELAETK